MLNKLFDEFNDMYGLERKPIDSNIESMHRLIQDEVNELGWETQRSCNGILNIVPGELIKEAIDTIYITCQQLRERGVNLDAALREVHRSNMSKALDIYDPEIAHSELQEAKKRYPNAELVPHGSYYVIKCMDSGKIVKPTTYSPAVITEDMFN